MAEHDKSDKLAALIKLARMKPSDFSNLKQKWSTHEWFVKMGFETQEEADNWLATRLQKMDERD